MDNWQAQQAFWESFGWPAYDDQTTFTEDDLPAYPHITYESADGDFGAETQLAVHLWNRSASWATIKQKAAEIKEALVGGGVKLETDNGQIWLKVPSGVVFSRPFATGSSDELVQRIMINVSAEFLSD
jgi:hypothetical protein